MIPRLYVKCGSALPEGWVALYRGSTLMWTGRLSEPWEDVDADTILLAKEDFYRVKKCIDTDDRILADGRIIP